MRVTRQWSLSTNIVFVFKVHITMILLHQYIDRVNFCAVQGLSYRFWILSESFRVHDGLNCHAVRDCSELCLEQQLNVLCVP